MCACSLIFVGAFLIIMLMWISSDNSIGPRRYIKEQPKDKSKKGMG